jgi:beta-ureidopropionase / N-carbamoyl-L-amino-acid hydrolase
MQPMINSQRLQDSLEELGSIGAFDSEHEGIKGVSRLALSDQDAAGRRLVMGWMREAGLEVSVDQIGNVFATRSGLDNTLAPVMAGSHVDSVPTGGRFDGALGVLGALEVVRTLNDHNLTTRRPLTIAFFTDEEGCRFGTDMLGSAVATGRIPLEQAWSLEDADGLCVRDELERIGFLGDEPVGSRKPHAFVECHVEQGPVLIHEGYNLGVVTGVQGISWQRLTITGAPAHAGTTPTSFRRDAGLVAAKINVRMREMCLSGDYGPDMRATMGVIDPQPGSVNVIPGRVVATVDLRNPDDDAMERAEADLASYWRALAESDGVTIEAEQTARTPAVAFDPHVQDTIAAAAESFGLRYRRILAGAGHDAQEWSRICPTAMVFVPGENDGISHNPLEFSTPKQCEDGINVLLRTILALSEEES